MKTLMLSVILASALMGCANLPQSNPAMALDPLLGFSDSGRCLQSPSHERLLRDMVAGEANNGFRRGRITVPDSFRRSFSPIFVERHEEYTVIGVSTTGTMFGLPLVSIRQALPEGGDPGDVTYTFEAAVTVLERELQARGFPAKADQVMSIGPPDGYNHFLHVLADPSHPGRAMFICGYT